MNWYKIASRKYYLETIIDGVVRSGSDYTLVLDSNSIQNLDIDGRIKHLQDLFRSYRKPFLRNVDRVEDYKILIELRLSDEDRVLSQVNVTDKVLGFGWHDMIELLNSGIEFATKEELKRDLGL